MQQDHEKRYQFFDKWRILCNALSDRQDLEAHIWAVWNDAFKQGVKKGRQDAIDEIEKIERSRTLPLEDPTRGTQK